MHKRPSANFRGCEWNMQSRFAKPSDVEILENSSSDESELERPANVYRPSLRASPHIQRASLPEPVLAVPIRIGPTRHFLLPQLTIPNFIIATAFFMMLFTAYNLLASVELTPYAVPQNINCSFIPVRSRYPEQLNGFWSQLSASVESMLNERNKRPLVLLLVHEDNKSVHKIVTDIAEFTASCFDPLSEPVEILHKEFQRRDYGGVIKSFYENSKFARKLIVIENLNEMSGRAALALQFICDTYAAPASNMVIFLTLRVRKLASNPRESVYRNLVRLWSGELTAMELHGVLGRFSEHVLYLRN